MDDQCASTAPLTGTSNESAQRKQGDKKKPYPKKRLIVCCDGTWNAGDIHSKPLTNVARIARCISNEDNWKNPDDPEPNYISQIVHYQRGVGLGTEWIANVWDGMTGRGL